MVRGGRDLCSVLVMYRMPKFRDPRMRMHMRISVHEDPRKRMHMRISKDRDPRMRMQMRISVQEDPRMRMRMRILGNIDKYHGLLINMICDYAVVTEYSLQNTNY